MADGKQRLAGIYTRQSHGKERSIADQERDGRQACDDNGWAIRDVYRDTISASRFATRDRADWPRLLTDLEAGRFSLLVMWEPSRGDRTLSSWASMLEQCRECGVLIHVISHDRTYDMRKPRDWRTLADDGVSSAYYSEQLSDQVRRGMRTSAREGRPHSRSLYGYRRVYDPATGDLQAVNEDPQQGTVVREIFTRAAGGEALSAITADLNTRTVPSPSGGPWLRWTVRRMLANDAYVGMRRHQPGNPETPVALYEAIWPPLVTAQTFSVVKGRLDAAKRGTKPGRQKYLLTFLARCAECDAHLVIYREGIYYRCPAKYCVLARRDHLDEWVTELTLAWIRKYGMSGVIPHDDQAAATARAEAAQIQAELDELAGLAAERKITPRSLAITEAGLLNALKDAQERSVSASAPLSLRSLVTAEVLDKAWVHLPLAAKREIISAIMNIRVRRQPVRFARHRIEDLEDRVEIGWEYVEPQDG